MMTDKEKLELVDMPCAQSVGLLPLDPYARIMALREEIGRADFDVVAEIRSLRGDDDPRGLLAKAVDLLKRWRNRNYMANHCVGCGEVFHQAHAKTCIHTLTEALLEKCGEE